MIEEVLSLRDQVTGPANSMLGAVSSLEGGLGGLVEGFVGAEGGAGGMSSALDTLVPGMGIAATAVMALGGALAGLVIAGASVALEQSDLKNRLLATFSAMEGGPAAGKATLAMLNDLSSQLPQTRDQLAGWTKQFEAMGVTDLSALRGQIQATASAQAIMGDEGASAYTTLTKKIQESILAHQGLKMADKQLASLATTGVNVADVAAKMGLSAEVLRNKLKAGTIDASKFGDALQQALVEKGAGPLQTMGASLSTQMAKLKENLGRLFEDVDPGPFLSGMKSLLSVFDQSTESGKALKFLVTGFFSGLFSIASKVFPYIRAFFLQLVIVGLKFYIALKPTIAAFKELFASKGDGDGFMSMVVGIADAIGLVLQAIATAISWFVKMLGVGKSVVSALSDAFSGVASIASNLVEGLVAGITSGIGKVVDAAKSMAKGAMDAIKGALGIHSPSAVMMQFGAHTAGGFAQGIANDNSVPIAAQGMAEQAIPGNAYSGAGAATKAHAAASSSTTNTGGPITVNVRIDGAGKSAQEITDAMVAATFERIRLAEGY